MAEEIQNSEFKIQNSDQENEVTTSSTDDSCESTQNGGAVAVPGNQTTAAPSFQVREVYDAERGEIVQRTPQQQASAHSLYSLMKMADLAQAILLKKFLDGEHHLDLGYSTREEFYQVELGISRQAAHKKLKVADRFEDLIPNVNLGLHSNVTPVLHGETPASHLNEEQQANLTALNSIGLSKWYEVARIEDADFAEVLNTGVVKFGDGREVALEDIQMRTRNEISKLLKGEIDGYKDRNAKLLDAKSELEAELKQQKKLVSDLQEKAEYAERMDMMHGNKAATVEGLENMLGYAFEAQHVANKFITKIKMMDDCPEDLRHHIVNLHRTIDGGRQSLYNNNYEAFAGATETRPVKDMHGETVDEATGEILN